ncbi:hypothetical protein HGRIS_009233 [Hohenbuehelia grisea]|uniref:Uncharacterized protein n=1 Tax=Hohenbuehelia grisea TaxID=104357 RepID=A0ABR3J0Q1_9AGAR
MAPVAPPHLALGRTAGRKITYSSPALVEVSKARLALDAIPDGAEEHRYYAFTTRILMWLVNTTTGLPRAHITNDPRPSTVVPTGIEPRWLDLIPQSKVATEQYREKSQEAAIDESIIVHPADQDLHPDQSGVYDSFGGNSREIPLLATGHFPSILQFPDPPPKHRLPQRQSVRNTFNLPPVAITESKRDIKVTFRVPDFIASMYSMDPVTGIWSLRPVLSVENKRQIHYDYSYEALAAQVREQAMFIFCEHPELKGAVISTLSLAAGKVKWCDWKWSANGPTVAKETAMQDLFVERRVEGPDGTLSVFDDFADDFKVMWKRFARRHYLQCNSFFQF